eukprot:TRINITY_DN14567_c0_g1_i2.p1 TRINITY_DN14567_c0_g1~~TRINITY_DN14567_c0_g1_i2.p1  ORF type:complete len:472 (+),score=68.86 TRINITY_DN14567_c0_g1_i2:106-1521(+)
MTGVAHFVVFLLQLLISGDVAYAACDSNRSNAVNPSTGMPYCVRVGFFKKDYGSSVYFTNDLPQKIFKACADAIDGVEFDVRQTDFIWGQGVDAVAAGDLDMFVGTVWILRKRVLRVDFTSPFLSETIGLLHKKPKVGLSATFFLEPFSFEVWIAWFASFGIGWLAIVFTEFLHCYRKGKHGSDDKHRTTDMFDMNELGSSFFKTMWWSLGLPFGTSEQQPASASGKAVQFSMQFMFLILLSLYTANLASFLTVNHAAGVVSKSHLLAQDVAVGPGDVSLFISSLGGRPVSVSSDLAGKPSLENGFQSVGLQDTELYYIAAENCNLDWINLNIPLESGFAVRHSDALNKLKRKFDSEILRLKENGSLDRWKAAGFPVSQCVADGSVFSLKIRFEQISGMYFILLGFMTLVVVFAFFERAIEKKVVAVEHAVVHSLQHHASDFLHRHGHGSSTSSHKPDDNAEQAEDRSVTI